MQAEAAVGAFRPKGAKYISPGQSPQGVALGIVAVPIFSPEGAETGSSTLLLFFLVNTKRGNGHGQ